jgi:ribosomal protein L40E
MADKVSFTNFGEKKKVRKVKRRGPKKPNINAEALLDEVLAAKKTADRTIAESGSNLITLPFLEFSVLQETPFASGEWNPVKVTLSNTGNGVASTVTLSFDNLRTRGQTIVNSLNPGEDKVVVIELRSDVVDKIISRLDVYYHSIEGDTFTLVRRDWFPNDYEAANIFESEIPPGEDKNLPLYQHREVMHGDFHIICGNCGVRAPTTFRICGKCGTRLQKRLDRRDEDRDLAAVQDEREILIKKLQKLGELKDKGMLSDDEFTVAKAQLLN